MLALNKIQPGVNGLAVIEREVREPGPGEMLVRVHAAGVCGTDMQLYQGAGAFAQRLKLPTTLGHEMCGTVVALGPEAATPQGAGRVKVGDLVSLELSPYDLTKGRIMFRHLPNRGTSSAPPGQYRRR